MASQTDIRKFVFQNSASANLYEVVLSRATDGSISGVGRLVGGTGGFGNSSQTVYKSDPGFDNTEITFVVLTAQLPNIMGVAPKHETWLAQAAVFNASNPAGVGAALGTLLT